MVLSNLTKNLGVVVADGRTQALVLDTAIKDSSPLLMSFNMSSSSI